MPIIWGERIAIGGARLPYTEVQVGDLVLRFNGRPGAKLREAVAHLEAMGKIRRPAEKIRGPQKPKRGPRR